MSEQELLDRFSKVFYSLRWEHRLTQAQVAKRTGLSPETVSKIENKESNPSLKICYKIAKGYNLTLIELFTKVENNEVLATKVKRKYTSPYN